MSDLFRRLAMQATRTAEPGLRPRLPARFASSLAVDADSFQQTVEPSTSPTRSTRSVSEDTAPAEVVRIDAGERPADPMGPQRAMAAPDPSRPVPAPVDRRSPPPQLSRVARVVSDIDRSDDFGRVDDTSAHGPPLPTTRSPRTGEESEDVVAVGPEPGPRPARTGAAPRVEREAVPPVEPPAPLTMRPPNEDRPDGARDANTDRGPTSVLVRIERLEIRTPQPASPPSIVASRRPRHEPESLEHYLGRGRR
jgi:hypothetical protein